MLLPLKEKVIQSITNIQIQFKKSCILFKCSVKIFKQSDTQQKNSSNLQRQMAIVNYSLENKKVSRILKKRVWVRSRERERERERER